MRRRAKAMFGPRPIPTNSTQSPGHVMVEGLTPTHRNSGMTDNIINISEWLKQKRLRKLKQMSFWYPIRDENEPLGYRFELAPIIRESRRLAM